MKNDFNVTILSRKELEKFKPMDLLCTHTNFAQILGGSDIHWYWVKNSIDDSSAEFFGGDPYNYVSISCKKLGIRPALKYSYIKDVAKELSGSNILYPYKLVEFGEYPQDLVDDDLNRKLEKAFKDGLVKKTGKVYTTDSPHEDEYKYYDFEPFRHIEYEYEGNKYIRVSGPFDGIKTIYDRPMYKIYNNAFWVKVNPIRWFVNENEDIALAQKNIISGIKYHYSKSDYVNINNFEETDMYQYLNTYFIKDILSLENITKNLNYNSNDYNEIISKKFK